MHPLIGWYFRPSLWTVAPWTKELYLCTVAPLSSLWPPPPSPLPKLNVQFMQTVCVWGGGGRGGGWIVLYRPCFTGILHSVSNQMQNLLNYSTTPNKMTNENDIKGLVSLKFLRPWSHSQPIGTAAQSGIIPDQRYWSSDWPPDAGMPMPHWHHLRLV